MALTRILCGPQFLGQGLGQADDGSLGGGVRRAPGGAEAADRRRHVDDAAGPRLLQHRYGATAVVVNAVEVDLDGLAPIVGLDVLQVGDWAGDPGVIDQYVEAAEGSGHVLEHPPHRVVVGYITKGKSGFGYFGPARRDRLFRYVAGVNPGTAVDKAPDHLLANAVGAGRDQYP